MINYSFFDWFWIGMVAFPALMLALIMVIIIKILLLYAIGKLMIARIKYKASKLTKELTRELKKEKKEKPKSSYGPFKKEDNEGGWN